MSLTPIPRVTRMAGRGGPARIALRFAKPLRRFVFDYFCGVLDREIRDVPVNPAFHYGLSNGTAAQQRHCALQHTHPPPGPSTK